MKSKYSKYRNVTRTRDLPATMGALHEFRAEMRSGQISLEHQNKQILKRLDGHDERFKSIAAQFKGVDQRFDSVAARFDSVDARFDALDAKIESSTARLEAAIHRIALVVEEQNAQNRFVLDKLIHHSDKQDRLELRVSRLEREK